MWSKVILLCFLLILLHGVSLALPDTESPTAYEVLVGSEDSGVVSSAERLIRFYQKKISPLYGPRCLFYPSCSEFCRKSIKRYGFLWGTLMTVDRLFYRESRGSMRYYPYLEEMDVHADPVHHNFIFKRADYYK